MLTQRLGSFQSPGVELTPTPVPHYDANQPTSIAKAGRVSSQGHQHPREQPLTSPNSQTSANDGTLSEKILAQFEALRHERDGLYREIASLNAKACINRESGDPLDYVLHTRVPQGPVPSQSGWFKYPLVFPHQLAPEQSGAPYEDDEDGEGGHGPPAWIIPKGRLPVIVARKYLRLSGRLVCCTPNPAHAGAGAGPDEDEGEDKDKEDYQAPKSHFTNWASSALRQLKRARASDVEYMERRMNYGDEVVCSTRRTKRPALEYHAPLGFSVVDPERFFPVNASISGRGGLEFKIEIIDSQSGVAYDAASNYPGKGCSSPEGKNRPFLVWRDGSRDRDTFWLPPNASQWSIEVQFPHLSGAGRHSTSWRFRISPSDLAMAARYPNLTFETFDFRCVARTFSAKET